jgi:hypothetical protein
VTTIDNLATAMSNFFRKDLWGSNQDEARFFSDADGEPAVVKALIRGDVQESTVCMSLDWPWLMLPAILCFITMMLLLATIILNRLDPAQPVWKASALPLLFYGLVDNNDSAPTQSTRLESLTSLANKAKNMTVQFQRGNGALAPGLAVAGVQYRDKPDESVEVDSLCQTEDETAIGDNHRHMGQRHNAIGAPGLSDGASPIVSPLSPVFRDANLQRASSSGTDGGIPRKPIPGSATGDRQL